MIAFRTRLAFSYSVPLLALLEQEIKEEEEKWRENKAVVSLYYGRGGAIFHLRANEAVGMAIYPKGKSIVDVAIACK